MDFSFIQIILPLLAIGCMGGFLSGLLGVGGGILFVPALLFYFKHIGMDDSHAMLLSIGTSSAIVLATIATSAFHHLKRGAVDTAIVKHWGVFNLIGVVLGLSITTLVNGHILKIIFALTTSLMTIYIAFSKDKLETEEIKYFPDGLKYFLCIGIGALASMVGMGGSILNIPLMTYTGTPLKRAIGTGSALGILLSFSATIGYIITGWPHHQELPALSWGYVNLAAMAMIVPTSMLLAPVGVSVSHRIPRQVLKWIFAAVLAFVSVRIWLSLS
jgi:hypothetical protein